MIAIFKYLKGCYTEDLQDLFSDIPKWGNNGLELQEATFQLNSRGNFLIVRTVQQWNQLPQEMVSAPMLETLKRTLENHLSDIF